jgi:hypothetical protein
MTLDDILDRSFPHATFHGAVIEHVSLDYLSREAIFDCLICIGDPDAPREETRETRHRRRLIFSNLLYCVIDPPDAAYPFQQANGLWVSSDGPIDAGLVARRQLPARLPDDAIAHWFFINDWNAFIYVAAQKVRLEWTGG